LAVLQFRFGWLAMWAGMILGMIWAQFNMATLAPIALDMRNVFPTQAFGVGRGFSLGATGVKDSPWISLNRIYFPQAGQNQWITNDKHRGQLAANFDDKMHAWTIAGSYGKKVYAKTDGSADMNLESLSGKTWTEVDGGGSGQLGSREGQHLRDKVIAFAKQQNVDIKQIFLVDGSHIDARANAFVGGMDGSIIGLYDTLFLGDHPKIYQSGDTRSGFFFMLNGKSGIRTLSEQVQSVDVSEEDNQEEWSSAPTQAMSDDEIVSILAHELAHVSEHHMEQSLAMQAATALVTFGALGFAAHSPLLALGLGLTAPLLWVGACTYDHLIGPPLDTTLKFFTDWHTRHGEYEADAYVARLSETYGTALQTSLAKLSVNSNQDPNYPWWYEVLHDDHPTFGHRWENIEAVKKELYSKP